MDQLTLGGTKLDVVPMTWGTQKQVFKLLVKGLGKMEAVKELASSMVRQMADGTGVSFEPLMDLIGDAPDLLTQVLALGLGTTTEVLDQATGDQVTIALEAFIAENNLAAQWERSKKAFSLLRPKAEAAG